MKSALPRAGKPAAVCTVLALALTAAAFGPPAQGQTTSATLPPASGLQSPARIAFGPMGQLVVSDYRRQLVAILNPATLKPTQQFSIRGNPLAVAYAGARIYVGNETRGCIELYSLTGKPLGDFGGAQGRSLQPSDIAVDTSRTLVFVVDGRAKRIQVFKQTGAFVRTLTGPAPSLDRLINPTAIALDPRAQRLYISDYGNPDGSVAPRILIYDYLGNPVGKIPGDRGASGLSFSRPQGLAVDGRGHLFVADGLLGQVLVFDLVTGASLKALGSFGSAPGQLMLPLDLVINSANKDIFVTNNRLGRIEVFRKGAILP